MSSRPAGVRRVASLIASLALTIAGIVAVASPANAGLYGVDIDIDNNPGSGRESWVWMYNHYNGKDAWATVFFVGGGQAGFYVWDGQATSRQYDKDVWYVDYYTPDGWYRAFP